MTLVPRDLLLAPAFKAFIEDDVLAGQVAPDLWQGLADLIERFGPRNQALLAERRRLQSELDGYAARHAGQAASPGDQEAFLRAVGYIVPEPAAFTITTQDVDPELALLAGPQLVVPADNARYALNATNARWGSLYDALYGTDAIGAAPPPGRYDITRGEDVVRWAKAYLDEIFPLDNGSHSDVRSYAIAGGALITNAGQLKQREAFVGYRGDPRWPSAILLKRNGLHVEICINRGHAVGATDSAGVSDILIESAISAIIDFEDAVAVVDAEDKVVLYRNWLGLMRGTLAATFAKNGKTVARSLEDDRRYQAPSGGAFTLKGRALLLVRNVGHLMTTPLVRWRDQEAPEGVIDAFTTALIGRATRNVARGNSVNGSVYIVKPKMHGPDEARFAGDLFEACEALAPLPKNTLKIGVMDEERRTSLNLASVIEAVKDRIVFTNTGFLDRTGDEIHSAMGLGPVLRKEEMRGAPWLKAYEQHNVSVALACGFAGRAQIGKGMWTMPDRMSDMLNQKIAHPQAGASTAWVPSPTAATLHATHYHRVDVHARQQEIRGSTALPADLLRAPLAAGGNWSPEEVAEELDNNVQSILGYIVRWIHQGIGCSKVPDLRGIALMEDRATCRISSQILANWLHWSVISETQLTDSLRRMAAKVDRQNADLDGYTPILAHERDSIVIAAARQLIVEGVVEPGGYTEPALHAARLRYKARLDAG